ncbi:MAG: SpoIIE family protein phosphatase [Gemmatales bacterium]|nr:SpoIIE family protein phosphatase [Gemmatales bacterium]MDW8174181.1 SpoIIE family protein phosphatase [Gemmatales bacterium]
MALNWTLSVDEVMVRPPLTITPEATACEAIRRMAEQRVGAVLVAEGEKLLGIFTERDVLRLLAGSSDRAWLDRPVRELMTTNPWTISPHSTWEQARSLMDTLHIRHVPVVEEGRLVGLVSARDLLNSYMEYLNRQVEARTEELRQANRRLEERNQEMHLHMTVAGRIQSRLLPESPPEFPDLHFATYYAPVEPLGGDYYNFATVEDRAVGILIADATGHSIPAALVAIMTHTAFIAGTRKAHQPATLLGHMNRYLHGLTEEHFVTAFYGIVDRDAGQFIYANAGHPKPWLYRARTQTCQPLEGHGLMLGVTAEVQYSEQRLPLEPGDRILLVTDGVTEARNEQGHQFGHERLRQLLQELGHTSAPNLVHTLAHRLQEFRGSLPQADDITIVVAAWH